MSCDPIEEKISRDRNATLEFSTDTVLFDTLLSSVGSITKRLRIYNNNENAVELSNLRLGLLENSQFEITVNGESDFSFNDLVIFGNDSITLLVTANIDPQDEETPYLVKDSIIVESNGNTWTRKLVAYGQDAIFINQGVFNCDITLTKGKPYVIYDFAVVDSACVLSVEPGTRILFDNSSFLAVFGTVEILGDTANPVLLRNTRLDARFENTPGQWLGIYFQDGSTNNRIDHAIISNAEIGLSIGNPENQNMIDVEVSNSIIENMSFAGIFTVNANLKAYNNVVNNCQLFMSANFGGGTYEFLHNTFVNTPNNFIRDEPSVQIADWLPISQTEAITNPLSVQLVNNIFWGDLKEELFIDDPSGVFENKVRIESNIIKSEETSWEESGNYISQVRNFPGFTNISNRMYSLDTLAFAKDLGISTSVEFDILSNPRDEKPDIGAYERIEND